MESDPKIVALAPADELAGFRAGGAEVVAVEQQAELEAALERFTDDPRVAVIVVGETVLRGDYRIISDVRRRAKSVIVVVPSHRGSADLTLSFMRHVFQQSIGVDLIGNR